MSKAFWKAALTRALRTVAQALISTIPVGLAITPEMIQKANWQILYVVLAWLGTGLLAGLTSILSAIATGLPEVDD